jgi:hypothetical protein
MTFAASVRIFDVCVARSVCISLTRSSFTRELWDEPSQKLMTVAKAVASAPTQMLMICSTKSERAGEKARIWSGVSDCTLSPSGMIGGGPLSRRFLARMNSSSIRKNPTVTTSERAGATHATPDCDDARARCMPRAPDVSSRSARCRSRPA